jgi:hypothetical protein
VKAIRMSSALSTARTPSPAFSADSMVLPLMFR